MLSLLLINWLIFGSQAQANVSYLPREINEVQAFVPTRKMENVFLPAAEIAWADYSRLKRDFPHLKTWSPAEIDGWLISNFAYISKPQLELSGLRTGEIKNGPKTKRSYRNQFYTQIPGKHQVHNQGRADTMEAFDHSGALVGLIDRKGAGVDQSGVERNKKLLEEKGLEGLRMTTGTNGLVLLGQAFVEVAMNESVQAWLEYQNAHQTPKIETIDYYFIMKLPFEVTLAKGKTAPAALIGRQAHIGRVWAGDALFPGVLNTKQFDFFMATTDPETIKIKHPVFDEVRSKVSHERRADLYFDRASDVVEKYLRQKDRRIVSDFIDSVVTPIRNHAALQKSTPTRVNRVLGAEGAVAQVASLIESDPARYHRFAEMIYWGLNRGSEHLFKNVRFQIMAEKFLSLPLGVVSDEDHENPRRYGIYMIPLLEKKRRAYWMEREIQTEESRMYLARMIWLLPIDEGRTYLAELYRLVPEILIQEMRNKLDQKDMKPKNFAQVIAYKAELIRLGAHFDSCEILLK